MAHENINEVTEAYGAAEANKLLAKGWTLVAVVQGTVPDAQSHIKYVLGRKKDLTDPKADTSRDR
ncbi:hypothetical protein SB759_05080 [Pseudomonas sp. SIMBA_059]